MKRAGRLRHYEQAYHFRARAIAALIPDNPDVMFDLPLFEEHEAVPGRPESLGLPIVAAGWCIVSQSALGSISDGMVKHHVLIDMSIFMLMSLARAASSPRSGRRGLRQEGVAGWIKVSVP